MSNLIDTTEAPTYTNNAYANTHLWRASTMLFKDHIIHVYTNISDLMRNLNLYNTYIYIHMFYFIYLVEWRCCVDRTVPEAIHNLVAIKLPVSDLLTLHIQVYTCF